MLKWLDTYQVVSTAWAADLMSAVGPSVSVPGMAETLPSVKATPFLRPLGKAFMMEPYRLWKDRE